MKRTEFAKYHFSTRGSVTVYYDEETKYFFQEFTTDVTQHSKEWFSRILSELNTLAKKGYSSKNLSLKYTQKSPTVTVATVKVAHDNLLESKYVITKYDQIFGTFDNNLYLEIPMTSKIKSLYDQLKIELNRFNVSESKGIEIVE